MKALNLLNKVHFFDFRYEMALGVQSAANAANAARGDGITGDSDRLTAEFQSGESTR